MVCQGLDPTGKGREYPDHSVTKLRQEVRVKLGREVFLLTRHQFPFNFHACNTMHSVAGLTLGKEVTGIVDNTRTMGKNTLYIALGRFADPKSIYLAHPIDVVKTDHPRAKDGFPYFDVHSDKSCLDFNKRIEEIAKRDIICKASSLKQIN